jgi:hypothetical protein
MVVDRGRTAGRVDVRSQFIPEVKAVLLGDGTLGIAEQLPVLEIATSGEPI